MKADFVYWLRWFLVLPGALVIGILSTFPLHWILGILFTLHGRGEEVDIGSPGFFVDLFKLNADMIEYFLYPAVIAITFIIVGSKIAPKYKFTTALVLFGIYIGTWAMSMIFSSSLNGAYNITWGRALFALLGAALGLLEVKMKNKDEARGASYEKS